MENWGIWSYVVVYIIGVVTGPVIFTAIKRLWDKND